MKTVETTRQVISREQWLKARKALLANEKELTRMRDQLSRQRRELPWEPVEKRYEFDGPGGTATLADLFAGRSQLIIYHFMFGPGWKEGCPGCSFMADHLDGTLVHLANRDVTLAVVSRAPLSEIEAFKKRMGWQFKWVSSFGTHFNYDFGVSFTPDEMSKDSVYYNYDFRKPESEELPGISVFARDTEGNVFHTYSGYARGLDILLGTYNLLDLVPKGRDETGPRHNLSDWLKHHDRYDVAPRAAECEESCCHGDEMKQPA